MEQESNESFCGLTVDSVESGYHQTCKIDLKPWHFWAKKGYKTFEVDGNQLEAYWDLDQQNLLEVQNHKNMFLAERVSPTRAKFDQRKQDSDIVVESSTTGPRDPEMWISIDGIVLIHIKNLQWKFRGNETVLVNKQPVQVFWDVHAWLFCSPGSGHGLFIFKPGASEDDSDREESSVGGGSDCSDHSKYYSTLSYSKASPFCLFLYAWKIE
ncbi:hypothetical protein HAX54_020100 [Datura stramonium]|uniref:Uncharacterized protein n=1 Tax=Datura stramonium TaxID=4076 RepID=A0ABS8UQC6_DATST|nr:hypothetical protein [Datura stramonium]